MCSPSLCVLVMSVRHPSLLLLSHDHHHGLALALRCRKQALGQLKPMGAPGLHQRAQEFLSFYGKNLIQHFRAEETVLFPTMRSAVPPSAIIIDELIEDHEQIRKAIPLLESESGLGKLVFDLGDLLERHIRKEERQLFPLFEQHISAPQAEIVGDAIREILPPTKLG